MEKPFSTNKNNMPLWWAAFLLLSLHSLFVYITQFDLQKIWQNPLALDFKYFYLAATCWQEARSPYGACPLETYQAMGLSGDNLNFPFYYPPTLLPLISWMSLLPPIGARIIWGLSSLACYWVIGVYCVRAICPDLPKSKIYLGSFIGFIGILMIPEMSGFILYKGQMTAFFSLALVILMRDLIKDHISWAFAPSLMLLMIKPQIGIPLWLFFILFHKTRKAAFHCFLICCILSIIAIFPMLDENWVGQFLANVETYNDVPPNWPQHMSGLGFLIYVSTSIQISQFLWLALSSGLAIFLGFKLNKTKLVMHQPGALSLGALFLFIMLISPMHTYDYHIVVIGAGLALIGQSMTISNKIILLGVGILCLGYSLSATFYIAAMPSKTWLLSLLNTAAIIFISAGFAARYKNDLKAIIAR